MIHLFHIIYVSYIIDLLFVALSVAYRHVTTQVIFTAVHMLLGKIGQIIVMWKVYNARVNNRMKFTKPVI